MLLDNIALCIASRLLFLLVAVGMPNASSAVLVDAAGCALVILFPNAPYPRSESRVSGFPVVGHTRARIPVRKVWFG